MNPITETPDWAPRVITLLAAGMLVVQFLMVAQRMLITNVRLFAIQSLLLAGIAAVTAYSHDNPGVYFMAALTLAGKVFALPWFITRLVRKIGIEKEMQPWINPPTAMLLCGGFTLLSYLVARPFATAETAGANTFGVSIALMLIGFFLMINRQQAVTQVLALLCAENGLFLAAISLTAHGMPLVVELGIFFDLFVAVMVLGILVYRIRATFASIDVERLNQLKG
jgi:hydrogenase-4 component E